MRIGTKHYNPCGCVWRLTRSYGDLVVTQCAKHASEAQETKKKRAAERAELVKKMWAERSSK
jgi:hypothetical protein